MIPQRGGSLHQGVDIATPLDSPVRSPVDGTIVAVGTSPEGGNYVIVEGANGDQWYLGHLNAASVARGDQVRRGQVIARSGNTGSYNGQPVGPHLHVQLRSGQNSRLTDPTAALERLAGTPTVTARRVQAPTTLSTTPVLQQRAIAGAPAQIRPGEPLSGAYLASTQLATVPLPATQAATLLPPLTVNVNGPYPAGMDPSQIKAMARQGAQEVLSEYELAERRQIEQVRVGGQRRGR